MSVLAEIFIAMGGIVHLAIFAMESLLFRRKGVYERFLIPNEAEAKVSRPWAFNQGFYNLFLAVGCLGGLAFGGDGQAIALFAAGCMAGAGIVLMASDPRMLPSAALQAVPPIVGLVLAAVH